MLTFEFQWNSAPVAHWELLEELLLCRNMHTVNTYIPLSVGPLFWALGGNIYTLSFLLKRFLSGPLTGPSQDSWLLSNQKHRLLWMKAYTCREAWGTHAEAWGMKCNTYNAFPCLTTGVMLKKTCGCCGCELPTCTTSFWAPLYSNTFPLHFSLISSLLSAYLLRLCGTSRWC